MECNKIFYTFNLKDITEILAGQAIVILCQLLNNSSTSNYLFYLFTRTHKERHFSSVNHAIDTQESQNKLLELTQNRKERRTQDPRPDDNTSRVLFLIENWYSVTTELNLKHSSKIGLKKRIVLKLSFIVDRYIFSRTSFLNVHNIIIPSVVVKESLIKNKIFFFCYKCSFGNLKKMFSKNGNQFSLNV